MCLHVLSDRRDAWWLQSHRIHEHDTPQVPDTIDTNNTEQRIWLDVSSDHAREVVLALACHTISERTNKKRPNTLPSRIPYVKRGCGTGGGWIWRTASSAMSSSLRSSPERPEDDGCEVPVHNQKTRRSSETVPANSRTGRRR